MHIPSPRRLAALTAAGTLATTMAACGSSTLNAGSGSSSSGAAASGSSSAAATATTDASLAAQVPANLKAKGTLDDGTDFSYAPNEFYGSDNVTKQGMDIDMLNAVATTLGLKINFNQAKFDGIILGVTGGKYDIATSSFTVNAQREAKVNMVEYYNAGTLWAVKSGGSIDPDNACGKSLGAEAGTVQVDDIAARSKKCTAAGKSAIKAVIEADQAKVTADVVSGKVDAMLADSPIAEYAVTQTHNQVQIAGSMYDAAPYGIVVPKGETQFAQLISKAFDKLKADGVYDAILTKWNVQSGAVSSFPVNPSV